MAAPQGEEMPRAKVKVTGRRRRRPRGGWQVWDRSGGWLTIRSRDYHAAMRRWVELRGACRWHCDGACKRRRRRCAFVSCAWVAFWLRKHELVRPELGAKTWAKWRAGAIGPNAGKGRNTCRSSRGRWEKAGVA